VGFLAGLSISPVTGIVLSSVCAIVVGATSSLAGLDKNASAEDSTHPNHSGVGLNPVPVAFLMLGIVAGSVGGILTRTHDCLGTLGVGKVIENKQTAEPRVSRGESENPQVVAKPEAPKQEIAKDTRAGVLYSAKSSECADWRAISNTEALRQNLRESETIRNQPALAHIASGCGDVGCLRGLVESLCGH
jgi:hypothetical protein